MASEQLRTERSASLEIFLFTLGNFIFYIPLYMMTKMASKGLFEVLGGTQLTSFNILPFYTAGNVAVILSFLLLSGWWRLLGSKRYRGIPLPDVRWYILPSAACIVVQIFTAIWAYAYAGMSIAFVALVMKGGVLMLAPLVDLSSTTRRRKIYLPSWIAAFLSLAALVIASVDKLSVSLNLICVIDITLFLASYFVRLSIMSRWAKSRDTGERKRYIVEEQLTIAFLLTATLAAMAWLGMGGDASSSFGQVWFGLTELPRMGFAAQSMLIGASAALVGIFASMVFLDRRENTFCVAAIQSSSIIAGVVVTWLLSAFYGQPGPSSNTIIGICIILGAILFLRYRDLMEKKNASVIPACFKRESIGSPLSRG